MKQALTKELRELKAEVPAVKGRVRVPPKAQNPLTEKPMKQAPHCRTCQQRGNGWHCSPCFRFGGSGNYVRECTAQFSRRSPAELLGNGQSSRPWNRVWPGIKISPVAFSVENKEQTMYRLTAVELVRSAGIAQRESSKTQNCTQTNLPGYTGT